MLHDHRRRRSRSFGVRPTFVISKHFWQFSSSNVKLFVADKLSSKFKGEKSREVLWPHFRVSSDIHFFFYSTLSLYLCSDCLPIRVWVHRTHAWTMALASTRPNPTNWHACAPRGSRGRAARSTSALASIAPRIPSASKENDVNACQDISVRILHDMGIYLLRSGSISQWKFLLFNYSHNHHLLLLLLLAMEDLSSHQVDEQRF